MKHAFLILGTCALASGGWMSGAHAQAKTPAPPGMVTPDEPHAATGNGNTGATGANGRALSSQLAQTNGTLRPAPVDPGMQKTPTQAGTMPVIRPPGTAGGPPGAVAK